MWAFSVEELECKQRFMHHKILRGGEIFKYKTAICHKWGRVVHTQVKFFNFFRILTITAIYVLLRRSSIYDPSKIFSSIYRKWGWWFEDDSLLNPYQNIFHLGVTNVDNGDNDGSKVTHDQLGTVEENMIQRCITCSLPV